MEPTREINVPDTSVATNPPTHQNTKVENHQPTKTPSHPPTKSGSKQLKKITSYLREESVKAMKRIAFEADKSDYEVMQEAVDLYLQQRH